MINNYTIKEIQAARQWVHEHAPNECVESMLTQFAGHVEADERAVPDQYQYRFFHKLRNGWSGWINCDESVVRLVESKSDHEVRKLFTRPPAWAAQEEDEEQLGRDDVTLQLIDAIEERDHLRAVLATQTSAVREANIYKEAITYVFGNIDRLDWKRIVEERLTPPWPLEHHAKAMVLLRISTLAVPDGWVLVPEICTEVMISAGKCQIELGAGLAGAWERMVANRPKNASKPITEPVAQNDPKHPYRDADGWDHHPHEAAQPRAIPDAMTERADTDGYSNGYVTGWNACRAAMLDADQATRKTTDAIYQAMITNATTPAKDQS